MMKTNLFLIVFYILFKQNFDKIHDKYTVAYITFHNLLKHNTYNNSITHS